MRRPALVAGLLAATIGFGCGDSPASSDRIGHPTDGSGAPASGSSGGGASAPGQPGAPVPAPTSPPSNPKPTGDVSFRVANFLATPADVCLKSDDGVWHGPLFHDLANAEVAPRAVTDKTKLANSHFVARIVDTDCTKPRGADFPLPVVGATWTATLVLGDMAGTPRLEMLLDAPTVSDSYSFVRLVHAASWPMNADLGYLDDNAAFAAVCIDAPFLATAKSGGVDAEGYGFIDPLDGTRSLVLRTTTAHATVLQLDGLVTAVDKNYTLFTVGTVDAPSAQFCDDTAPATADHLTPCQTLPAPPPGP